MIAAGSREPLASHRAQSFFHWDLCSTNSSPSVFWWCQSLCVCCDPLRVVTLLHSSCSASEPACGCRLAQPGHTPEISCRGMNGRTVDISVVDDRQMQSLLGHSGLGVKCGQPGFGGRVHRFHSLVLPAKCAACQQASTNCCNTSHGHAHQLNCRAVLRCDPCSVRHQ